MLFVSEWLTYVAFLHLSIENDQSFDMLDGYRMQTSSSLDKTQCSGYALVFTSLVRRLLCSSVDLLCSRAVVLIGLHIGQEVVKVLSLVYSKKENQPSAMHLILNKHFLLYSALLEPHHPHRPVIDSPDQTTLHDSLPNLRCLVYILSATTLLNQGFLKKHFFTFLNIKK